jgi:glutamine synthetase
LQALQTDDAMCSAFGSAFVAYFAQVKQQEIGRFDAAVDKTDWQRREYFSRY